MSNLQKSTHGGAFFNAEQTATLKEVSEYRPSVKPLFERAYSGNSKAAGIKAKCLGCCGYQSKEVTNCTSRGCPLWPYRPFQSGEVNR